MATFLRRQLNWFLLCGYGLLVVAFLLTPLIVLISMSFSSTGQLVFPPVGFSLQWYPMAAKVQGILDAFILSLELAILTAILSAALGTLGALAMARHRFPGKSLIMAFFLSPLVFPSIVVGVALLQFYRMARFDDVFATLLLAHVIVTIPYTVRTVTASLEVFDYTLLDAARVLGADTLKTFTEVMLPIIKPGVFSGAVFAFLISFDNYTVSMFLTDAKNISLPIRIFNYAEFAIDPTIAAISTVMILVSVLLFVISSKLIGVKELAKF